MKKVLFICMTVLLFTSCITNDEPALKSKVVNLHVDKAEWKSYSDGNRNNMFYAVTFQMPEIDDEVYDNGAVHAYLATDTQAPLPAVRHLENASGYKWTRTIDFDYQPGTIRIFVTASDFIANQPESMDFKVIVEKQ